MDDARRLSSRDGYQFEHPTVPVRSDRQQSVLAVVVVLDESNGMGPRMLDIGVADAVLAC